MKNTIILHPLLFGAFSVLFLFSANVSVFPLNDLWPSLILTFSAIAVTWAITHILLNNGRKTALLISFFWVMLLSYAQIFGPLQNLKVWGFVLGLNKYFVPLWTMIVLVVVFCIIKSNKDFVGLTRMLNIVSVLLVLIPACNITAYEYWEKGNQQNIICNDEYLYPRQPSGKKPLPDIYYLIFDRYASSSTLKESFGYDNSDFDRFLIAKGFYVANQSHANYSTTFLSIASSLNMSYLVLPKSCGRDKNSDQTGYLQRITDNSVLRFLKANGYKTYHFGSWYWPTHTNPYADINIDYSNISLSGFNLVLFENSVLYPFARFFFKFDTGLLAVFEDLAELPDTEAPKYVFAHVLLPHDPYLFRRDGQPLSSYEKLAKSEKEKYLEQLIFTTKKMETLIDALLSKSERASIIILQSDEGPYLDEGEETKSLNPAAVQKRTGILNAYYLPGAKSKQLFPTITPVNSFRVVFNEYFGTEYEILEDKSYYIKNSQHPFDYTDVTNMITRNK